MLNNTVYRQVLDDGRERLSMLIGRVDRTLVNKQGLGYAFLTSHHPGDDRYVRITMNNTPTADRGPDDDIMNLETVHAIMEYIH